MAKNDKRIPDSENIVRFCKPSSLEEDGERIGAPAFMLRENEQYLSVDWLQRCGGDSLTEWTASAKAIYSQQFKVRRKSRIAVLLVGKSRMAVHRGSDGSIKIDVLNMATTRPSYSGVFGMPNPNHVVAEILSECVETSHNFD